MQNINLEIFELSLIDNALKIGLRIRGDFNSKVRKPIITVIFDDGTENRRMPMSIQAYYPNENLTEFTIFAGQKYMIKHLFFNTDAPGKVKISIDLSYGDEYFTSVICEHSSDFITTSSKNYSVAISKDKNNIVLSKKGKLAIEKTGPVGMFLRSLFGGIWNFLLNLFMIILFPFICIEGILAMFNCVKPAPKNVKTGIGGFIFHIQWRMSFIVRHKVGFRDLKRRISLFFFNIFKIFGIKKNRVTFISNRRDNISGNYEYIYKELVKNKNLDIRYVLDTGEGCLSHIKYGYYLATSKVILIDDYVSAVYFVPRRAGNYLIQVWHACGAFKTFGFSRLGKSGAQKQGSYAHRNYDYCTVSSKEICRFYAEGFGLSLEKVVATGVPRTDIFFSEEYKERVVTGFYKKYPHLNGKKIILFAPTFRGNNKTTGNYPENKFDFIKLYEKFKGEYAIIIKHHPFVNNKTEIPSEYREDIIDMSDNEELNDLLFVTDILITDYSSVVFEASLLNIPMLFYAFDLQNYISTRGFYYEYDSFVPGKIVSNMTRLIDAVKNKDFEDYKIADFRNRFFDELDGRAGYRVAKLIEDLINR